MSGIQTWSRGTTYPATVVCVGGFPTVDNDATAEVWYRGVKIKGYQCHSTAELIAKHLSLHERHLGVDAALERAEDLAKWNKDVPVWYGGFR